MITLSQPTLEQLIKAGWQPSRTISTLSYQLALRIEGYPWFSAVEYFLQRYGGLRIAFRYENGNTGILHFDARKAAKEVDTDWAQDNYIQRIGCSSLCIIGQTHSDHMSLYMDEEGKVYGGFDDFLCLIAENGEGAIETICQRMPTREIPSLLE
ncbi:SUKH-3 domain-containing protein [Hymenobacter pini]|uniref:SUKH-3 domain-containing protein n=1 Tax=Hymenobacter pini TaxID=2880879 RepID=UPI001CF3E313|nr:SUKH-3 domain-containing protein [Hymenobacter pini]MCA8832464.1 SUKH-3 domain-containing protein [Hymenobacter pini]